MTDIPPIHVQVLVGPAAGQRLSFDRSPVSFGRQSDNDVVLPMAEVSRRQGELRYEGGGWVLRPLGENPTLLAGKKVKRPTALGTQKATISVGSAAVMHAQAAAPQPTVAAAGDEAPAESEDADEHKRRKRRLTIGVGIGAYMLILLGIFAFFYTLETPGQQQVQAAEELTYEQVQQVILQPPEPGVPDQRAAARHLREATELHQRAETRIDGLYRAYDAYRRALAASGQTAFEQGIDQLRYQDVEQRLIDGFYERYREAYTMLRAQQYQAAARAFDELAQFFPERDTKLYENVADQQRVALQQLREQKKSRW